MEWLVTRGHGVRVVTAPPYYPGWKVWTGYSRWRYSREMVDGAVVYRAPLWVPRRPSGLKRVLHLLSYAVMSFPVMVCQTFWRPDVVLVVQPALFCSPAALFTAWLSGVKCCLHVQDFEVDAAFELSLLRGKTLRRLVSAAERFLMKRFSRVSTISPSMVEALGRKGVPVEERILFPNWVETNQIYPLETASPFRRELGLEPEHVVILYAGNMGEKQGLEIVVEAAHRLREHSKLRFVLCGEGSALARLRQLTGRAVNIHWLALQPKDRLNELLNLADIHVLPQRADAADLVMPSKLTGMLASGRAIVATAHPKTQVAVLLDGLGAVVPPDDTEALVEALVRLADAPEQRRELGAAARGYAVRSLDRNKILQDFEEELKACCSSTASGRGTTKVMDAR